MADRTVLKGLVAAIAVSCRIHEKNEQENDG